MTGKEEMMNMTLEDCVKVSRIINSMLNRLQFDAPEKGIIALYLEETAKAECREIEELERMVRK